MIRLAAPVAIVCCTVAFTACGRERREPQTPRPMASKASKPVRVERAGLSLDLPANAGVNRPRRGTMVLRSTIGEAAITIFAYPRTEQLPRTDRELADARRRLAATVTGRDAAYRLTSSRATRIGGNRAVELTGDQTFSRTRVRTRSLHVFRGKAEYVIEIAAPAREFPAFDRRVSAGIERSLRVTGTVRTS